MTLPRRYWFLALFFLDVLVIYVTRRIPYGRAQIWILPQARGMIVMAPDGEMALVDGSPQPPLLADQVGRRLPPLWGRLRLAVVARSDEGTLAAQAELFRHVAPTEAWLAPASTPRAAEVTWQTRAHGHTVPLHAGLSLTFAGVTVRAVDEDPPALTVTVGRVKVVYAPAAHWQERAPRYAQGALVWLVNSLRWERATTPTPAFVVLPQYPSHKFGALAPTLLRTAGTDFLVGETRTLHVTTDGQRYAFSLER